MGGAHAWLESDIDIKNFFSLDLIRSSFAFPGRRSVTAAASHRRGVPRDRDGVADGVLG